VIALDGAPGKKELRQMKYMMLMQHSLRDAPAEPLTEWPGDRVKAHVEFMRTFNEELRAAGEFVGGEGLAFADQAKIVQATDGGVPAVTDGPFPESKEFLAGYWIIDVESEARAIELAATVSTAPGPDGAPLNMPIEIRPVMAGTPADL
jgi:hypothetical protein